MAFAEGFKIGYAAASDMMEQTRKMFQDKIWKQQARELTDSMNQQLMQVNRNLDARGQQLVEKYGDAAASGDVEAFTKMSQAAAALQNQRFDAVNQVLMQHTIKADPENPYFKEQATQVQNQAQQMHEMSTRFFDSQMDAFSRVLDLEQKQAQHEDDVKLARERQASQARHWRALESDSAERTQILREQSGREGGPTGNTLVESRRAALDRYNELFDPEKPETHGRAVEAANRELIAAGLEPNAEELFRLKAPASPEGAEGAVQGPRVADFLKPEEQERYAMVQQEIEHLRKSIKKAEETYGFSDFGVSTNAQGIPAQDTEERREVRDAYMKAREELKKRLKEREEFTDSATERLQEQRRGEILRDLNAE